MSRGELDLIDMLMEVPSSVSLILFCSAILPLLKFRTVMSATDLFVLEDVAFLEKVFLFPTIVEFEKS